MVYSCQCLKCKERVVQVEDKEEPICSKYHGRSARCLYSRQKEHFSGWEGGKEENALHKHKELFHPGEECQFSFEAEKFFNDAVSHQIYEGVCINNSPLTLFEQGGVARLVVAHGL